jgi:hypothetical protein
MSGKFSSSVQGLGVIRVFPAANDCFFSKKIVGCIPESTFPWQHLVGVYIKSGCYRAFRIPV